MMTIYSSQDKQLKIVDKIEDGVWVNLVDPSEHEIREVNAVLKIDVDFIRAALDEEERSRIEPDDDNGSVLIVVDVPYVEFDRNSIMYATYPLGIIFTKLCVLTVSLRSSVVIESFTNNAVKTFFTYKKSRFILQLLYRIAALYLQYLKQIDKQSNNIERELHKSMKNQEIVQLMELEKGLVYFSTSLKSNELVMEKLLRYNFIKKYPEDTELLEDTITENKQAIEMAKIYQDILSSTMDTFASIISNNLNIAMKFLASVTILMSIPTVIASMFGMNLMNIPFADNPIGFPIIIIISLGICTLTAYFMARKKMF